ncbi:MAG: hypothetical protein Q7I97_05160 [Thermovirgaceae bacterium]|nr:hypothetical protein [Thermovirgaceae bacterium]
MEGTRTEISPPWLILLSALVVPGSAHVFLGRPNRGLVMLFWMVILGFMTFRFAPPQAGFIGQISGGVAVWALSVVDAAQIMKTKNSNRQCG